MPTIEFNRDKFRELMLYVAQKCAPWDKFGSTKLNKILFFSDFMAHGYLGRPITGATYQRLDFGPAPREYLPTLREMRAAHEADIQLRGTGPFAQKRLVGFREPQLDLFTGPEIALVDSIIDQFEDHSAEGISNLSHRLALGWQIAEDGEEIPYSAVFLSCEPPTADDVRRGQELAAQHGWVPA